MAAVNLSDALTARATSQAQATFAGNLDALAEVAVAFYLQVQQALQQVTVPAAKGAPTKAQIIVAAGALNDAGHLTADELAAIKADPAAVSTPTLHPVITDAIKKNVKATVAAGKATVVPGAVAAADNPPVDPKTNLGPNIGAIQAVRALDPVEAAAQAIAASGIPSADIAAYLAKVQQVAARIVQL